MLSLTSHPPRHPRHAGEESRSLIKDALRKRKAEGKRDPILVELANETGLSKTTVHHHLKWLEERGEVRIEPPRREIVLVEGGQR